MIFVYAAVYLAAYRIVTEIPRVLRADPPSDALYVGLRGTLSLTWRHFAVAIVLGVVTAHLVHGTP